MTQVEESASARDELEVAAAALYAAALAAERGEGDGDIHALASAFTALAKGSAVALVTAGLSRRARQLARERLLAQEPLDVEQAVDDARAWAADVVEREREASENERSAARESSDRHAELKARSVATQHAAESALGAASALIEELNLGAGALKSAWISRSDPKVRELHRKLHGKTKRLGDPYYAWLGTGQQLRYPGDPEAPLDATAGCRCSLWFAWAAEADAVERALSPPDVEESFAASAMPWAEELHPRSPDGRFIEKWMSNFVRITSKMRVRMHKLLMEHGEVSRNKLYRGMVISNQQDEWNEWLSVHRGQKINIPTSSWSRQPSTARDFATHGGNWKPGWGEMKVTMMIQGPHLQLDLPYTDLAEAESVTGGEFRVIDVKHDRNWTNVRVVVEATPQQRVKQRRVSQRS